MPYLLCNHARLFYEESGKGPETIVFSHGLLFDHRMWDEQVSYFKSEFRCIAYDHRGQGQSEVTGSEDMESLYEDAAALIEKLCENQRVHFVGLSMGGFIGMRLAARKPHLLKSLTLLETSADLEPNKLKYSLLNTVFKLGGASLVSARIIRILFGKSSLRNPERKAIISFWESTIRAYPKTITKAVEGVIHRKGILNELKDIHVPTLILVGTEDIATSPVKAEQIHQGIVASKLIVMPGVGHSSCIENPQMVSKNLSDFIKYAG